MKKRPESKKKLIVIMSGPCSGNVLTASDKFYSK